MSSAGLALGVANARYWTSVAPLARAQLRRWEDRAEAIPDPALRAIALAKLQSERFNAEVAATLATLAPRPRRAATVEAIVALEVMYDYLDGLTEQPAADPEQPAAKPEQPAAKPEQPAAKPEQPVADPLHSGRRLFMAFTDALLAAPAQTGDYFRHHPSDDGGYLAALSATTSSALARLPGWNAVSDVARGSAARCAEGQVRVHAAPRAGVAQLEEWARAQAASTALPWREFMAGAVSSVLAVHALIATAANDRTTPTEAAAIDSVYLSISALSTMFDSVIDYERDSASGEAWYVRHYDSRAALADRIAAVMRDARQQVQTLPNAAHHTVTLVGVVAYYMSAPQATQGIAAPLTGRVHDELGPLMAPTLAVMRAWRGAKRLRLLATGKRRTTLPASVSVDEQTVPPNQRLTATTRPI
jgi:tetraprenyl-beta-curcumene synthase